MTISMWTASLALVSAMFSAQSGRIALVHASVEGAPAAEMDRTLGPGLRKTSFETREPAVLVPHCNGRGKVTVDGATKDSASTGPLLLALEGEGPHRLTIDVTASAYEKRVACSGPPIAGKVVATSEGLTTLRFASPAKHADAGQVVVFVPKGHSFSVPGALLVGLHPWNGSPWTYAAYEELLDEAQKKDVVLAMPSGLGNSLYTAEAEDEVMHALDAVTRVVPTDPQRISIWGASMGGAGATTISFHYPDRFASVASWFGDSKYDMTSYVRGILGGDAGAHQVNALDMIENARYLRVYLVHGEDDRTSPIAQSTMLDAALKKESFRVELARVPGMGHEGPLVVKHIRRVVERAAEAVAPVYPARVSYRSVREGDLGAYGVTLVRKGKGDAVIDIEDQHDGVHVLRAENVAEVVIAPGALDGARIVAEGGNATGVPVRFAR